MVEATSRADVSWWGEGYKASEGGNQLLVRVWKESVDQISPSSVQWVLASHASTCKWSIVSKVAWRHTASCERGKAGWTRRKAS